MLNNINLSKDASRLYEISQKVANATRGEMGQEFGKPMSALAEDGITRIAEMIAKEVFGAELNAIAENKSLTGVAASESMFKEELIKKFKEVYTAAAENSIFRYSQNTGHYISSLGTIDQLHLVALIAGVVQSTYNVIFKTHVEKGLTFTREVDLPYVITHDGQKIDFFDLVNNADKLRAITNINSPTSTIEFAVQSQKVTGNLIDEYNKALLAANPNSTLITGPYDFLNRGIEIVAVEESGQKVNVRHVTTGYPTQSGQRSDVVATINAVFTDKETNVTKTVKILGSVRINGDIEMKTDGTAITKVWVKFNLPPIGPRRPLQFSSQKAPVVVQMNGSFSAQTTLNEQFKQHHALVLGKDLIEEFHKYSMTTVNRVKDQYAFDFIDDTIKRLDVAAPLALDNFETTLTRNRTFAKVVAKATDANKGYVGTLPGNEDVLAQAMFKVTNQLEVALNPKERRYMIYSSSAAAQWVREADGSSFNKFQELGDLGDQSLAGLSLPYSLKKVKIGGHATGYFISTNAKKDYTEGVKVTFTPRGSSAQVTGAPTQKHRYVVKTDYEATLDTYLFLQGPEYIEQGTGTDQFARNTSLNLETMYDMTAFNESIGVVDFTEEPLTYTV